MCSCGESGNVLPNNVQQLYSGFLLHYKAKWFGSDWSRVFGVLYQDSTLVWYENQMASRPEGTIFLKLAPELIAAGQYSRRLFHVPPLPNKGPSVDNVIAVGERRRQRVHFFLAESEQDLSAWWTAIVSTLPVTVAPAMATAPGPKQVLMQPPQPIFTNGAPPPPVQQPMPVQYVTTQQQPSTNNTVVIRDSGPSYGGAAVGLAAGAVMGAALSDLARPNYYYGGGWGSYGSGGYVQDNDVTVVNNYNVDYNSQQNVSTNFGGDNNTDWSTYDDFDGGDL